MRVLLETPTILVVSRAVTAFAMNQYGVLCKRTQQACLIDCGDTSPQDWVDVMKKHGGPQATIHTVLQTHAHIDHIYGLFATQTLLPMAKVHVHKDDMPWWDGAGLDFPGMKLQTPRPPDVFVKDNDTVRVGELSFRTIHTPGHTAGEVVFFEPVEKILFSGDMLFQGSIGRTDFPLSDAAAMVRSIKRLFAELPDDTRVFPGHNEPTTIGEERRYNPFYLQVARTGKL